MSIFYGKEIEIWAGFGPVGSTYVLKKNWADFEQLLSAVFLCLRGQIFLDFFKNVRTKNLNDISLIKKIEFLKLY